VCKAIKVNVMKLWKYKADVGKFSR